jgi:hypothetical protein
MERGCGEKEREGERLLSEWRKFGKVAQQDVWD